jgi:hypothetical protein
VQSIPDIQDSSKLFLKLQTSFYSNSFLFLINSRSNQHSQYLQVFYSILVLFVSSFSKSLRFTISVNLPQNFFVPHRKQPPSRSQKLIKFKLFMNYFFPVMFLLFRLSLPLREHHSKTSLNYVVNCRRQAGLHFLLSFRYRFLSFPSFVISSDHVICDRLID